MYKLQKRANRGETLVETLAAILVIALSATLLVQLTMTSTRLNRNVEQADGDFRAELAAAEGLQEPQAGVLTVQGAMDTYSYEVEYYGEADALRAYRLPSGGDAG